MTKVFTRESHGFALRVAQSGDAWIVWIRRLSDRAPIYPWAVFNNEQSAKQGACVESRRRAGLAATGASDCDCEARWTERRIVPSAEKPSASVCPCCVKTRTRNYLNPSPELQNVVLIRKATVRKAEQRILSCEACNPDDAQVPFDYVLDCFTGQDPTVTAYIMERPARCPSCWRAVKEKTLVDWIENS